MQHTTKDNKRISRQQGVVTLFAVLVASTVTAAIIVHMILSGIDFGRMSQDALFQAHARTHAHACAEEALEHIRDSGVAVVPSSGGVTFPQGSCSYTVSGLAGDENRIVYAVGVSGEYTRRVLVEVSALNPFISVDRWEEVGSF